MPRRVKRAESEQAQAPTQIKIPGFGIDVSLPPVSVLLVLGTILLIAGGSLAARASFASRTPNSTPTVSISTSAPTIVTPLNIILTCSLNTQSLHSGMTIIMTYAMTLSQRASVGLGAAIYDSSGNDDSTGYGDIDDIQLPQGQVTESRPVPIPSNLPPGNYEIDAEVWPPNEIGQDGARACLKSGLWGPGYRLVSLRRFGL